MTSMAPPTTRPAAGRSGGSRLQLLDGFGFEVDGQRVELPLVTQRVVAFLALHERPLLRTYVAGCLWLDKSTERSHANLRSALWRLRRPAGQLVECCGAHLRLSAAVEVDVHRVTAVARAQLDAPESTDLDAGSVLLAGDLLPDWYDDWVVVARDRFRQLRLHAIEASCERLTRARRYADAVDLGMVAVAAEPLRDSAHRVLIRAHLAEGNAAEAAHRYVLYRDLIWEALGVEPSRDLKALVAGINDSRATGHRHDRATSATPPAQAGR